MSIIQIIQGKTMNHFTETTHTSFLGNIGNSLKGIVFGFLLLIISIVLLSYNEHRSINQTLALEEMQAEILHIDATPYNVAFENKPVHIHADVLPDKQIEDSLFGVKSNALVLRRNVSMYQWVEEIETNTIHETGGSSRREKTYVYTLEWSNKSVNSSSFKYEEGHENPDIPYKNETFVSKAKIGEYALSEDIVRRFDSNHAFSGLENMPKEINAFSNHQAYLYRGKDTDNPVLGDLKVIYKEASKGSYTLVGKVQEKSLVPYVAKNNVNLFFIREQSASVHQIFKEVFEANKMLTWGLRLLGIVLMYFGFSMIMGLFVTLANVLPFLGTMMGGFTGIVTFLLTFCLSTFVIAIAWFAVRPMLSFSLMASAVTMGILFYLLKKKKLLSIKSL